MTAMENTYLFEGKIINPLIEEFVRLGNLTYDTISRVFGPAPRIPDSPDMDARMDAWNDQAEYSSRIQRCEEHIKNLISSAEKKIYAGEA